MQAVLINWEKTIVHAALLWDSASDYLSVLFSYWLKWSRCIRLQDWLKSNQDRTDDWRKNHAAKLPRLIYPCATNNISFVLAMPYMSILAANSFIFKSTCVTLIAARRVREYDCDGPLCSVIIHVLIAMFLSRLIAGPLPKVHMLTKCVRFYNSQLRLPLFIFA